MGFAGYNPAFHTPYPICHASAIADSREVYDEFDGIAGEIIEATQPRDFPAVSSEGIIETPARKGWPAGDPCSNVP